MPLTDYRYISTRKVEELGAQVEPSVWERLEPSVGVKAFWFELGVTLRQRPTSRYSILRTVTEKLAEEGNLGRLDDAILPLYVQGTMEMRYGSWEGGRIEIVWFLGSDETHLVGLGGRLRHMLEVYEDELRKPGEGSMPLSEKHNAAALASHLKPDKDDGKHEIEGRGTTWTYDLEVLQSAFYGDVRGTFEFVAKVEDFADVRPTGNFLPGSEPPERRYVIGSPVWIAKIR
jgi:hypothetical protein